MQGFFYKSNPTLLFQGKYSQELAWSSLVPRIREISEAWLLAGLVIITVMYF